MRLLSAEEAPDSGERLEGHNVVIQYFAQDEATRMDPKPTVYETLASGSPHHMVPAIRNILGGFLFSGDDVRKPVRVLSGGERTRLAVARMLLRPSNTLLLDEPTNHLDLDSKEVLLDALVDYGGTLIFVSHDRYFVERLATKIIEVGNGTAVVYPGTYAEFRWHKEHPLGPQEKQEKPQGRDSRGGRDQEAGTRAAARQVPREVSKAGGPANRNARGKHDLEGRKKARAEQAMRTRITDLETRIADTEAAIRDIENAMAAPGFYEDRAAAQALIDRRQGLMWQVGDLMHQWEELQALSDRATTAGGA
jgi:ATP-binding cassette subfamily F protein 3